MNKMEYIEKMHVYRDEIHELVKQQVMIHAAVDRISDAVTTLHLRGWDDMKTRLDTQDKSIEIIHGNQSALMNAYIGQKELIDHIRERIHPLLTPNEQDTEQPPTVEAAYDGEQVKQDEDPDRTEHIYNLAGVCQTTADVLLICRYLKNDPDLTDETRDKILYTACTRAGVLITPGLQILAGKTVRVGIWHGEKGDIYEAHNESDRNL